MDTGEKIRLLLDQIYGEQAGALLFQRLSLLLDQYPFPKPSGGTPAWDERDTFLITYPDQLHEEGRLPLGTLADFCNAYLRQAVSCIHLLPFYPWSSDDGFSVVDYRQVSPADGSWEDIRRLGEHFRLMFDMVVNHVSVRSAWFQGFLRDDPRYRDYFIEIKGNPDLSGVIRPRDLPLLSPFHTPAGDKKLWTTFSPDQVDLNYHNPEVLLEAILLLLFYVGRGAEFLRLDAVGYLWKEIGTPCINLPQTHRIVQVFRAVLERVAPQVKLVTETNIPFQENLSYFGDGSNEAHLIYNFALPPLVLHALQTGSAGFLTRWAQDLVLPSERVTFFNFLASHDGIGLNPVRDILPQDEIDAMIRRVVDRGGLVSYKSNPQGTKTAYELNVNYLDALAGPQEPSNVRVDRFVAAHALMLAFKGIPGIYFHSLVGSRGWKEGVALTGHNRSINRQKLEIQELKREFSDRRLLRSWIFNRLENLLKLRAAHSAFAPQAEQYVLKSSPGSFSLLRRNVATRELVLCMHNLSPVPLRAELSLERLPFEIRSELQDWVGRGRFRVWPRLEIPLRPYQFVWLGGVDQE